MPRQARLDSPGTLHHVMARGIEGRSIFVDEEDREDFLSRIGDLAKKTDTHILAWALMDNHLHLLLFSGPVGLSTFMRRLLTGYAIRFNRRHRRAGHLFQNRYKSIVCEKEPYLLELVRYIHLNPLRKSAVRDLRALDGYRWSGHSVLMGRTHFDWQDREYVLGFFSNKEGESISAYRQFVRAGKVLERRPDLAGLESGRNQRDRSRFGLNRVKEKGVDFGSRVLGSEDFVQDILCKADKKFARRLRENKQRGTTAVEIVRRMCQEAGVSEEGLRAGNKRRRVAKVRGKIAFFLNRELGLSLAEIGRHLGVGTSAIAMAIRKKENNIEKIELRP